MVHGQPVAAAWARCWRQRQWVRPGRGVGHRLSPLAPRADAFAPHRTAQNVARFCRDGKAIVTGGEDGVVRVWELTSHGGRTGATMRVACSGHGSPVSDLACHADGQLVRGAAYPGRRHSGQSASPTKFLAVLFPRL